MSTMRFVGTRLEVSIPTPILATFLKPGHQAELREQSMTQFMALELTTCYHLRKQGWVSGAKHGPALGAVAG